MTNNFPKASRPVTEMEEVQPRSTIARTMVATPQMDEGPIEEYDPESRKGGLGPILFLTFIIATSSVIGSFGALLLFMNGKLPFGLQEGIESKVEVTETVTIPTTTPARTPVPATAAATPAQTTATEAGGNPSKNPAFQADWEKEGTKKSAIAACTVADGHYDSSDAARHELAIIWYALCQKRFEDADMPQSAAQAAGAVERATAKAKSSGRDLGWLGQLMGGEAVAADLTVPDATDMSNFPNPAPDMGIEVDEKTPDCYAKGTCF